MIFLITDLFEQMTTKDLTFLVIKLISAYLLFFVNDFLQFSFVIDIAWTDFQRIEFIIQWIDRLLKHMIFGIRINFGSKNFVLSKNIF